MASKTIKILSQHYPCPAPIVRSFRVPRPLINPVWNPHVISCFWLLSLVLCIKSAFQFVSPPVYAHAGEDVTLSCSLDTHVNVTELQVEWRKTDDDGDILVLLYDYGENRPESQDERYSGRAEFFTEEIPKGIFSMKLRKVRTEDKGEDRFYCFSCAVTL
uniref:Ig-like domain-containing protein n=1 Tax=Paramormyrops kingsleyae TaxID=1676925 RepID=A0A3B3S970_9TELE